MATVENSFVDLRKGVRLPELEVTGVVVMTNGTIRLYFTAPPSAPVTGSISEMARQEEPVYVNGEVLVGNAKPTDHVFERVFTDETADLARKKQTEKDMTRRRK